VRVSCAAGIHGVEFVGAQVLLGVVNALAGDHPLARRLRERAEVHVLPCLNPDAYARTWAQSGEGTVGELRCNARGVDLNRNFPRPHEGAASRLPGAGSDDPDAATYRGPSPLSEPETRALDQLLTRERFTASINLHSCMGTIIPARTRHREDFDVYKRLCRQASAAQPRWPYRRLSHRVFDVYTGEQEDHQHHVHGTWAACLEVFPLRASVQQYVRPPVTFWRFNPHDPSPWVDNDVPAVLAWLDAAIDIGRSPQSPR